MEDYEINDVRNRQIAVLPLINISAQIHSNRGVYIKISNVGSMPAFNVSFSFPDTILWRTSREVPSLIANGTKYFPPNKTFNFFWNTVPVLFHQEDRNLRIIDATATYLHPQNNQYVSDTFHIDLEDYRGNSTLQSDVSDLKDVLKDGLSKLSEEISKLNSKIEPLQSIAGSSGLDLSITTLRNLRNIISGDGNLEKINTTYCSSILFQEVLNIDEDLADDLEIHFGGYNRGQSLEEVKNITPEIIAEIKKYFIVDE